MADEELEGLQADTEAPEEETKPLNLEVQIASPSACERHVTVTVAREDVDRYLDEAYSELMPTANVPGFRIGRAPRKLVENKFRKDITEKTKGTLLLDCLSQISEEKTLTAISEPDLDLDAFEIPDEGPLTFEFDIEVRPDFDLPKWKGVSLERPIQTFTDADIDAQLKKMLTRFGQLVPFDGPAETGDFVTVNLTTSHDGKQLESSEEDVLRIREKLSFRDGEIADFGKLMNGATAGEKRSAEVELTQDAPNEALRGQKVTAEFEVLEVKKLKLPELTEDFLDEMGSFKTEADLRDAIKANLERQLEYHQQQEIRSQISALLTKSADWELPPGLLKRQSSRELERTVMELRRAGFSEADIRARENMLRQNSAASTARSLKEHFILEKIAEEEKIEAEEGDFEKEIFLIAMQSGESPRRVRAQIEKRGLMDVLQNQIIERKVLELVQSNAKFIDKPHQAEELDVEAIHLAAGGGGSASIPEVSEDEADES
jgi:trigger factor